MTVEIKHEELDRELPGPETYEKYNALAKKCKRRYTLNLLLQLAILLIISILSAFGIAESKPIQIVNLILIILFLYVQFRPNELIIWQKARYLAESVLSEAWFFLFSFDIYDTDLHTAHEVFLSQIRSMKKELGVTHIDDNIKIINNNNLSGGQYKDSDYPQWVKDNFEKDLIDRTKFYLDYRIDDQITYYEKTSQKNRLLKRYFYWGGVACNLSGITLTIFSIGGYIISFAYLGLFITISGALVSWNQAKKYEEICTTSSVAKEELEHIRNELLSIIDNMNEAKLERKIFEAEKLISREHKVKRG